MFSFARCLMATALVLGICESGIATANGLDRDVVNHEKRAFARNLPATLVIRVNEKTNKAEVYHSDKKLAAKEATVKQLRNKKFTAIQSAATDLNELDGDASEGNWYFYYSRYRYRRGFIYYPYYYYGGYNYYYNNYYSYYWGGYNYYYYRWRYYW